MNEERLRRTLVAAAGLYNALATCHPKLERGQVWCRECGSTRHIDTADCFRHGWPKCCGATMTIDAPEER